MIKKSLVLIALILYFPVISQAQSSPQPPASWIEFQKAESAKRHAFFQEMKADRDNFFSTHPEAKAYVDQLKDFSKQRREAWKAAHHK